MSAAPVPAKPRVLIIEDDPAVRAILYEVLAGAGYRVVEAADGKEGLRLFETQAPGLVVTDMLMPEKDGIETIVAIRRKAPDVGIVAISGGGRARNMGFLDFSKTVGATEVLAKPFSREQLLDAVHRALTRAPSGGA